MAAPNYKRYKYPKNMDMPPKTTDYTTHRGYYRDLNYDTISTTAGVKFVGGLMLIIFLVIIGSWIKTKWNERAWTKEWDKDRHQKQLDERKMNSEGGVKAFGYEDKGTKQNQLYNEHKQKLGRKGAVVLKHESELELDFGAPDEVYITVQDENGKNISGKHVKAELQLLELTRILGLKFVDGCVITITTEKKEKIGAKDVQTNI